MGFTVITSAASHHRVARRREEPRLCGFGLGPSDSGGGRFAITGLTGALFLAGRYQKVASSVVASVSFPRASRTKNLGSAFSQHYDDIAELSTIAVMCCFTPKSGPWNSVVECPLCAKNGLMQCSKISRYSIASSATASSFGEIRSAPP